MRWNSWYSEQKAAPNGSYERARDWGNEISNQTYVQKSGIKRVTAVLRPSSSLQSFPHTQSFGQSSGVELGAEIRPRKEDGEWPISEKRKEGGMPEVHQVELSASKDGSAIPERLQTTTTREAMAIWSIWHQGELLLVIMRRGGGGGGRKAETVCLSPPLSSSERETKKFVGREQHSALGSFFREGQKGESSLPEAVGARQHLRPAGRTSQRVKLSKS